ncbi:MAG: hypothetical protein ACLFVJ_00440 [Persicimonas sp.]
MEDNDKQDASATFAWILRQNQLAEEATVATDEPGPDGDDSSADGPVW